MKINAFTIGSLGTNCYVVWDDDSSQAMIVDPGAYDPVLESVVSGNGLVVKYIALTHGHCDHIGGIQEFKSLYPGALLAVGEKEIELLGDPEMNGSSYFFGERFAFEPDVSLKDGDTLALGGLSFTVIETPGHTPGGVCYYIPECDGTLVRRDFSGTLFAGDTLFQASIGRTDLAGGDFEALKSSIRDRLFVLPDDTLVLPGHMDATTIGNEKQYNPFVR